MILPILDRAEAYVRLSGPISKAGLPSAGIKTAVVVCKADGLPRKDHPHPDDPHLLCTGTELVEWQSPYAAIANGKVPGAVGLWWLTLPLLAVSIWAYARDGRLSRPRARA